MDVPVAANILGTLGAVSSLPVLLNCVLTLLGLLVNPGSSSHPRRRPALILCS